MREIFLVISSILAVFSYIVYFVAILKGQAKPHRTTRFVLFLINFLAFASLLASHSQVTIWLIGIFTINSLIVFILSLKYGMGGWAKTDILCLIIALVGIGLWKFTNNQLIVLYAIIVADFTGIIPTLIKTYRFPETEVWTFFAIDLLAVVFSIFAIKNWTPTEFVYPLYLVFIDFVLVSLVLRPKFNHSVI